MNEIIKINKLDAARRQLGTAIELWFNGADPVSVHTLASAAHEVVHSLLRARGLEGLLFDHPRVREQYRSAWNRRMKEHYNFFKHADKDPLGELDLNPGINEMLVLFVLAGVERLGETPNANESAMGQWLALHKPDLFHGSLEDTFDPEMLDRVRALAKPEFFSTFVQMHRHIHS